MEGSNNKVCSKCKEHFTYFQNETWWNNYGTYSVKLCKCSHCGTIQSVKFEDAAGLNVNYDRRYF